MDANIILNRKHIQSSKMAATGSITYTLIQIDRSALPLLVCSRQKVWNKNTYVKTILSSSRSPIAVERWGDDILCSAGQIAEFQCNGNCTIALTNPNQIILISSSAISHANRRRVAFSKRNINVSWCRPRALSQKIL